MTEPIIRREHIAQEAEEAAIESIQTKQPQANPYPPLSEAHRLWRAAYERFLLLHSTGEVSA